MIISEIGQNWINDTEIAKTLIRWSLLHGAESAKFQLFDSEKIYGKYGFSTPDYQQAKEFFEYGKGIGIDVFYSVFDRERIKWCEEIGVKRYKIAFSERHNQELIEDIINTGKELIISCDEQYVKPAEDSKIKLMYCVPYYPATITWWPDFYQNKKFEGFSDHSIGLDACKIALARGAKIIEKHMALDHNIGVDAGWSMTPHELRELREYEHCADQLYGR